LCKGSHQEENIEKELKLIVEYFGEEGEEIILSIFDQIILVVLGENCAI